MEKRKVNWWGASLSIRLNNEFKEIGVMAGEEVNVRTEGNSIVIEKVLPVFKASNGVTFKTNSKGDM